MFSLSTIRPTNEPTKLGIDLTVLDKNGGKLKKTVNFVDYFKSRHASPAISKTVPKTNESETREPPNMTKTCNNFAQLNIRAPSTREHWLYLRCRRRPAILVPLHTHLHFKGCRKKKGRDFMAAWICHFGVGRKFKQINLFLDELKLVGDCCRNVGV